MVASVYVESSVISYLTSRTSRDLITAARQAITVEWWNERRGNYEVLISALVEEEVSRGDPEAAESRLISVKGIVSLDISEQALELAEDLVSSEAIPTNSRVDALHIGIAAANGVDYLLTWNFKHINNAETKAAINKVVERQGLTCPTLCSPEELGA
jgi:hypothetical protein